MKKICKITLLFLFMTLVISTVSQVNATSNFEIETMDFNAVLNENGSMNVTETWRVKINGTTNTLFKTFETDKTKYDNITNVSVAEITNGQSSKFLQSNYWKNHVDTDYFHALNHQGDFEIAWGVNKSSGTHTYNVSYTVNNVINVYSDCAELYWQFIGDNFETPIENVTGTIYLPESVENIDDLRVWGHGQLNGEIQRENTSTVKFNMSPYITGTYLEIRLAILKPEMFYESNKTSNILMLQDIIDEETTWANEANAQRERIKQRENTIFWGSILICSIVAVTFIWLIIKNIKKIKETPKMQPTQELEYYREIPNEDETPSSVAFLYYYGKTNLSMVMPKILSSTILNLALKKYISFEINKNLPKNEEVTIKLEPNKDKDELKSGERIIYQILKEVAKEDNKFNMKEFEKYAKKNNREFLSYLRSVESIAKAEQENEQNFDEKLKKQHDSWINKGNSILTVLVILVFFALGIFETNFIILSIAIIPAIVYILTCYNMSGKANGLTQKGLDEKEQWEGLKKYMEDFSLIKDREVIELVLWEKYLVYATLFGNAEKVLKQLKVVYPEFSNDDYLMGTTYFYLIAHTDFNSSFVNSVNTAMQRAYQSSVSSSSYSSGGGFGGGFSGGGGGRRWRWPAEAVAKTKNREKQRKNEFKKGKCSQNNQNYVYHDVNFGYFAINLNILFEIV